VTSADTPSRSRGHRLPAVVTVLGGALLLAHGPLTQTAGYNDFADHSVLLGIPHAADVLSNIGFALVALWGWIRLHPVREHAAIREGWSGYRLFLLSLGLTAVGSAYYHLAPDNARLVWDRLPIALAAAGLLAAVRAETQHVSHPAREAGALSVLAVASVGWWYFTDGPRHPGDLRPYAYLQALPLVLVPLWQALYRAPRRDRLWFGAALLLYILAKLAEFSDRELLEALGVLSGHTLKHLLAAASAAVLISRLAERLREAARQGPDG
jgi:hypothetical protein